MNTKYWKCIQLILNDRFLLINKIFESTFQKPLPGDSCPQTHIIQSKSFVCYRPKKISVELVGTSLLMPLFPDDVIEVRYIPVNAISISVVNIPHSAWQLKVVEDQESCIIPHHSSTAQRTNMRQQKQNSWTTIQLQEHHRHTSTQLQTNWLPLIQLKCMPLHQRKCIILRIKLADIVELLAISLSATIIRINIITWQ